MDYGRLAVKGVSPIAPTPDRSAPAGWEGLIEHQGPGLLETLDGFCRVSGVGIGLRQSHQEDGRDLVILLEGRE